MAAEIVLLIAATLLAWTYLLWPAAVIALAAVKRRTAGKDDAQGLAHKGAENQPQAHLQTREQADGETRTETPPLPSVSVIMSAYNEAKVIREKMISLQASDYPAELTEFMVGSDCSFDGTDEILKEFAATDNRLRYFRSPEREGKACMLNRLASRACGEILVITDANVIFTPGTLRELAAGFNRSETGLCDATVIPGRSDAIDIPGRSEGSGISHQENFYSRFETTLKRAEGELWGAMPGPYGGCYAVRCDLFPEIPANTLVDDLFVGLTVLAMGYRSYNIPGATVIEDTQPDLADQFRRRIRIAAGSFQNLFRFGPVPSKRFAASFVFLSHKVLRWSSPLLLALFFMTTVILSGNSDFYLCVAAVQLIFLILPALDLLPGWHGKKVRYLRYMTQFLMMNAALAAGFVKALRGIKSGIWEPTKRV
jgi:cellulose synthase/poly-beta-1,6-N-acetylglucosamine synthase-like glycosyltransferase